MIDGIFVYNILGDQLGLLDGATRGIKDGIAYSLLLGFLLGTTDSTALGDVDGSLFGLALGTQDLQYTGYCNWYS